MPSAVRHLRQLVSDRQVLVVGSAASGIFPEYVDEDWVVLCVNGSFKCLPQSYAGLRVGLITDAEQLIPHPKNPSRVNARQGWTQVVNSGVFGITSNRLGLSRLNLDSDEDLRLQFKGRVGLGQMRRILYKQTLVPQLGSWPWGLVSTGFKAIALSLYAGAASVSMTGFTLQEKSESHHGGHGYTEPEEFTNSTDPKKPRTHSASDALLLSAIACRGERRLTSLEGNLDFALRSYFDEPPSFGPIRTSLTRLLHSSFAPW